MIKNEEFIKSCEVPGPSKEEIRALLLYKSELTENDKVIDIGCGTGGISTEFAKIAKEVIAIDKNPEAITITNKNIKKHNVEKKVKLIENDGISALQFIENIDIAIIGGSGNDLDKLLELIYPKLNSKGRILITAILVDTKVQAINKLKELGFNPEITEVNISKGRILDRGIMMTAQNPIAIINAKKENKAY